MTFNYFFCNISGGFPLYGVGAEVCAQVIEGPAFHHLDAPVIRVAGADVPMPYAKSLELRATPQAEDVVKAVDVANEFQDNTNELLARLGQFEEKTLNFLAMEVAREFADYHSREDIH